MTAALKLRPLTSEAFAPFGDVIEATGQVDKLINQGKCARYHDRAVLDFHDGRAGISVFQSEAFSLPIKLEMVERHPDGSQAFLPLSDKPFVVVVAPDENGTPGPHRLQNSARTGCELPSQHLAWRSDPASCARAFCGGRPNWSRAQPRRALVRGGF